MISNTLERLNIGNKEHQMQHVLSVEVGCQGNMKVLKIQGTSSAT